MEEQLLRSMGFGVTSGVITTLGLIVGLDASTGSRMVVLGGILSIAIADALSDATGMHISEEAVSGEGEKIWGAMGLTFLFKLLMALTFTVPVVFLTLQTAVVVNIVWGLSVLAVLSWRLARHKGENPWFSVGEHLAIALGVVVITRLVGLWIKGIFGG
ncbi:MAG TPA: hypothetical protein ENN60_00385 [archaeon]|nr:hypothetical protein [archaeon]